MSLAPVVNAGSPAAAPAMKPCLRRPSAETARTPRCATPDFRVVSWTRTATGAVGNCLDTGFVKQAQEMFASAEDGAERKVDTGPSAVGKLIGRFFLAIPATIARAVGTLFAAIGAATAGGAVDLVKGRPPTISFNETVTVVRRAETPHHVTPGLADPDIKYAFVGDTASFGLGEFDRLPADIRASVLQLPPTDTFASSAQAGAVDIEESTAALQPADVTKPGFGRPFPTEPSLQDRLNVASLIYAEDGSTVSIGSQQMQDLQTQTASRDNKAYAARILSDAEELLEVYRETEADWRALLKGHNGHRFQNQYNRAVQRRRELQADIESTAGADRRTHGRGGQCDPHSLSDADVV